MARKRAQWLNSTVIGATITSFLSDTSHEVVTVFLPSFLLMLGAPVYALGLIEGVSDAISSFAKLGGGWLADKTGKHKEISTLGYCMTAVFPAMLAVAASWPMVLFGRVFGWFGRGLRGPPRDAILSDSVDKRDLGKAFGLHRAGDTLGAISGPMIAMLLITSISLREVFWLSLIPGVMAALAFWFLVRQKKGKLSPAKKSFSLSLDGQPGTFKSFLVAILAFGIADFSHTLLIFFAVATLSPSMGAVGAAAAGAGLYLVRNIAYALLCYPFGWMGDRFGRRNVLAAGYALAVLTFIGFILSPPSLIPYAVLFAMAGAFIAAEDTLEGAIAGELADKSRRALGFGMLATANGIGDFISSAVVSGIWAIAGFRAGFAFSAIVGAIGTVILIGGSTLKENK